MPALPSIIGVPLFFFSFLRAGLAFITPLVSIPFVVRPTGDPTLPSHRCSSSALYSIPSVRCYLNFPNLRHISLASTHVWRNSIKLRLFPHYEPSPHTERRTRLQVTVSFCNSIFYQKRITYFLPVCFYPSVPKNGPEARIRVAVDGWIRCTLGPKSFNFARCVHFHTAASEFLR